MPLLDMQTHRILFEDLHFVLCIVALASSSDVLEANSTLNNGDKTCSKKRINE
jgi:hypothetical protein